MARPGMKAVRSIGNTTLLVGSFGQMEGRGLLDVRRAPIASEFCVAAQFRNVPNADINARCARGALDFGV